MTRRHPPALLLAVLFSLAFSFLAVPVHGQGLHYTDAEVQAWRERAQTGPYLNDWSRIVSNKDAFMSNPGGDRWGGYDGSGCVPKHANIEPRSIGFKLRDAAFYSLVQDDARVRDVVYDALIRQINEPGADFSVRRTWCLNDNRLYDINPGFVIAEWATRVLFTYDYIRPFLSDSEKAPIEKWLSDAAYYFRINGDESIVGMYSDWEAGVLNSNGRSKAQSCDTDWSGDMGRTYKGGPRVCTLGKYFNNRRAHMTRFYALTGILLGESVPKTWAKRWVKEYVKYHVYPDRSLTELHRGHGKNAALGWAYAFQTYGDVMDIVDTFARHGDTSLYDFSTSDGGGSTAGGPKTVKTPADFFVATSEGDWRIYNWNTSTSTQNLIDGVWYSDNYYAFDVWLAQYNLYWRDAKVKEAYLDPGPRNKQGTTQPREPLFDAMGSGKAYPGKLFMFGQLEGKVHPYSGSTSEPKEPEPEPEPEAPSGNLADESTHTDDSGTFHDQNPLEGFWDGDVSGSLGTSPGSNRASAFWVEYDLGERYDLTEVRLHGDDDGSWVSTSFTVAVKDDAADAYEPIIEGRSASGNRWFTEQLSGVQARFVRVNVKGDASINTVQAREFEVYGTPSDGSGDDGDSGSSTTWTSRDVGAVRAKGSTERANGKVTVAGSGRDIWHSRDEFHFSYQKLEGDGTVTARVDEQSRTHPWAKAGVMIRETLKPGSKHAMTVVTPGHGTAFQRRTKTRGTSDHSADDIGPWVRIQRRGNVLTSYASSDGRQWKALGSVQINMGSTAYAGLAVTSHSDGDLSTAVFSHVSISTDEDVVGAQLLATIKAALPPVFRVGQNYPNPFGSSTTISYQLPEAAEVRVEVYDALGRRIATLVDAHQTAGQYDVDFEADTLPSGVYFYRVRAGEYEETRQMVVVR